MKDLFYAKATDLLKLMRSKKISAREVMQAHLERIAVVNPKINALTQRFSAEICLQEADKIDAQLATNLPLKPLAGLPVTIKDLIKVKGLICSSGSQGFYKFGPATEDATVVKRLKEAGAIVIGLTNVPELCRGGDSSNLVYGTTNNPYNFTRTSGGSSGGSAALLAAGGSPLSIGTDGGGSLVQPSHYNGITCLKPTHGLLPGTGFLGGDIPGIIGAMVTNGPMARYVEDLKLVLPYLAGPDGISPYTPPVPLAQSEPLSQLRVAYFTENGFTAVDKEIQNVLTNAALSLKGEVASISEARPDCISSAFNLHWDLFLGGDRGLRFKQGLQAIGVNEFSWEMQEFLRQAESCELSVTELQQRMADIDKYRLSMMNFMQDYEVVLSPVFPKPAKPHGIGIKEISDFSYAMTHNLTGWPTVSVRCGTSKDGLPIGVLIAAKPWKDTTALAVAERLEQLHGGWQPPPPNL
jgi:amidase